MSALLQLIRSGVRSLRFRRRLSRWQQVVFSLLLGIGLTVLCLATRAHASDLVILQYYDRQLAIPRSELQAFADQGTLTPELDGFLKQNRADPEQVRRWLTVEIGPEFDAQLPEEFVLIQINKTLGDPLGREDLTSLRQALASAYRSDQTFSLLEVLQKYPKDSVRLTLNSLERAYNDISLFVTRIQPVLNVTQQLLPELLCNCSLPAIEANPQAAQQSDRLGLQPESLRPSALGETAALIAAAQPVPVVSAPIARSTSAATPVSPYEDKQLVLAFGPFRPSMTIGELTRFVETGELSRGWRFYFNVAKVDRDGLRVALSQAIQVKSQLLDQTLNSLLGEYALYEVGKLVQTPSDTANIQALRSAIMKSVIPDNRFSMLELLQNYPLQQVQINGIRLARLGSRVSRLIGPGGVEGAITDLESWLVKVQTTAAENLCNCSDPKWAENPLRAVPNPTIDPAVIAQYLPVSWQPIPPHREDRGNIKVVWLQGSPYEMGYQHGQYLHDEIASIGEEAINFAALVGKGLAFGRLAQNRTYASLVEECRGLVDATQDIGVTMDVCMTMSYADVFQEILGYTLPQELFWEGCNQFVATGSATIDGRLYHGSSVDNDKKPVPYVMNNPVIFVRQPNDGLPHVFVTYPGVLWPNSGMNVAGISLGLDTAHPDDADELSLVGRSNVQIMAKILETATSFEQARQVMETQPRVRANLIMITDGKSQQAGVFEFTGKSLAVRSLQPNGVLYVTNHFVLPEMYDKQPLPIDPSSQSRFDRFSQLLEPNQPNSFYGQLQPQLMAQVLRDRTNPYTQQVSPPTVFDDDASPGGNGALRQAIYDPGRLKLWVAAGQAPVPENPFVCFSMRDLLNLPNASPCESPQL